MKSIVTALICMLIVSCNSNDGNQQKAQQDTLSTPETVQSPLSIQFITHLQRCEDMHKMEIDTLFDFNTYFHLKTICNEEIKIYDTISLKNSTSLIYGYRENSYAITVKTKDGIKKIKLSKESFGDSLAMDLKANGILTHPYEITFEKSDSTIRLRSFIGFPESDFGDMIYYKINRKGKLTVLAIEEPTLGDN